MEFRSRIQRSTGWYATVERPKDLFENLNLGLDQIKKLMGRQEYL